MPLRAAPPDRRAVEDALSDDLHRALIRACALLELPHGPAARDLASWAETPVGDFFATLAVRERAIELIEDEGFADTPAEKRACEEVGVKWETYRSRRDRWTRTAYGPPRSDVQSPHGQASDAA